MMKYLLTALLAVASVPLFSQIKIKLEILPDNETYFVSMLPEVDYPAPGNLMASGQFTIRVPHGLCANRFEVADLTMEGGASWSDNGRVDSPIESPSWDYISFGLVQQATNAYTFVAGVETPLFSFKNGANFCADSVEVINNMTDPFLPPNSANANIGNSIVVFGGGPNNIYDGAVNDGIVTCTPLVPCYEIEYNTEYLCNGETYNGIVIEQDTTIEIHYTSCGDCDSGFVTNIIVWEDDFPAIDTAICQGEDFGGTTITQNETISVVYPSFGGCDSTQAYNVEMLMPTSETSDITIFAGQTVNGVAVYSDSILVQNLTGFNGCDSIHTTNVTVSSIPTEMTDGRICQGEMFMGQFWSQDTVLIDTLLSAQGFDSAVHILNLTVDSVYNKVINKALCEGESYLGNIYSENDTLMENLQTIHGCDSTVITFITVVPVEFRLLDTTICAGELFFGEMYESDTTIEASIPSSILACDSIVFQTNLQVLPAANANIVGETEVCGNAESELTATGGDSFAWNTGDTDGSIIAAQSGTYAVTVTNGFGCSDEASIDVEIAGIDVVFEAVPPPCSGGETGSVRFMEVQGGLPPYTYSIDGGTFSTSHTDFYNLSPGTYELEVRDASGCAWTESLNLNDPASYFLDLGPDLSVRLGEGISLEAATDFYGFAEIQWAPAQDTTLCDTCLFQEIIPLESTTYRLTLTDSAGCSVESEMRVTVDKGRQIYVPTAFSPNGDGLNDRLTVQGGDNIATVRQFVIFERWGGQVFQQENFQPNDFSLGWDGLWHGKPSRMGTYVWMAEVEFIDGHVEVFEGGVLLVR